ncbi:MAG: hypothetical protein J3Q66DRAFT_325956, partial [Benniella sp.]
RYILLNKPCRVFALRGKKKKKALFFCALSLSPSLSLSLSHFFLTFSPTVQNCAVCCALCALALAHFSSGYL